MLECDCCNRKTYGDKIVNLKAADAEIKAATAEGWYFSSGNCICPECKEQILNQWLEAAELQ